MNYPPPGHCATIWTSGGQVYLALPPSSGHSKGHTVHFPASPEGLATALLILKARESHTGPDYLGLTATPDQALALHLARHRFAVRGCPHCAAEGRAVKAPREHKFVADGSVRVRHIPAKMTGAKAAAAAKAATPAILTASAADLGLE